MSLEDFNPETSHQIGFHLRSVENNFRFIILPNILVLVRHDFLSSSWTGIHVVVVFESWSCLNQHIFEICQIGWKASMLTLNKDSLVNRDYNYQVSRKVLHAVIKYWLENCRWVEDMFLFVMNDFIHVLIRNWSHIAIHLEVVAYLF